MSLDPVKLLAKNIADTANEQEAIKQNISGDDTEALLQIQSSEILKLTGTLVATKYTYATDSFVIDHPVYGALDSSVLKLDGGYGQLAVPFTLTFPVTLGTAQELLYSTTF
jgi:hypothetical protein